ncbi:DsbA family protein [Streptomyces sp. NBC_00536]|nr:thioredoxin domain-containing protein [Streptomyces sp. NBC_00536]WUC78531.1 DsbA family protein [Streptomyces sp. NBC_00536]
MSDKNDGANRDAKRTARERLLVERERQKSKDKRRRSLVVAAAVVGVLGLAAVVGLLAANSGKSGTAKDGSGPVVAPSGATGKDALAVQNGKDSAKSTLTVWEDFRCPACKSFEDAYRTTVHDLVAKGQLKVEYHLVTLIDGNMSGSGSQRAANAAACAQDAGKFPAYHDVLFENQPKEVDDAYGKNARLLELAGKVDGLDTPAFRQCVEGGTHDSWVAKSYAAFKAGKFRGTPTILLDGKDIFADQANPLTPEKLKAKVTAAAGAGAPAEESGQVSPEASARPSASPSPSASASGRSSARSSASTSAGTSAGTSTGRSAGAAAGTTGGAPAGAPAGGDD